jgi:gas vesicle protein
MKTFLAGLGIGFVLGVLFAPMRGEDTREILTVRASEMADTARDQYQKVQEKAASTISTLRGETRNTGT